MQAVLFYQPKLVKLISEKFPLTTKVRLGIGAAEVDFWKAFALSLSPLMTSSMENANCKIESAFSCKLDF